MTSAIFDPVKVKGKAQGLLARSGERAFGLIRIRQLRLCASRLVVPAQQDRTSICCLRLQSLRR